MPLLTNYRHLGRFSIHIAIINTGEPSQLKNLFGKMIITRAELMLHSGVIEYVAVCDDFKPIKEGQLIPYYRWLYQGGIWKCEIVADHYETPSEKIINTANKN